MGYQVGGSGNGNPWEKFRPRNRFPQGFETDQLSSRPRPVEGQGSHSGYNELEDAYGPASGWNRPTYDPDPDFEQPAISRGFPWRNKPPFSTNGFTEPVQNQWNGIGTTQNRGPLIVGGPVVTGQQNVSRGPALDAIQDMLDENGVSKFDFTGGGLPKLKENDEFFEIVEGGKAIRAKGNPADAIRALIDSKPKEYGFECATAISAFAHIQQYRNYQAKYGAEADARFNKDFEGLQIGMWGHSSKGAQLETDESKMGDTPKVGEGFYFQNANVDAWGKLEGWSGENVVYAGPAEKDGPLVDGKPKWSKGDDLYYGHPFGLTTRQEIASKLVGAGSRINPDSEDALAQAAANASGPRAEELSSLLAEFQTASRARKGNKDAIARLHEDLAANRGTFDEINPKYQALMGQDPELDQAEQAVADRARVMLSEVEKELKTADRFDRPRLLELRGLRDALKDVITGDQHITGYKQAPYQ